jgi:hypothetical protein
MIFLLEEGSLMYYCTVYVLFVDDPELGYKPPAENITITVNGSGKPVLF